MSSGVVEVEGVLVDAGIKSYFACDLKKCKGVCCFMRGEYGAPLLEEEVEKIEKILPVVLKYLPEKNKNVIYEKGFFENTIAGITTTCVDDKECVFVHWDNGLARCSFETAYLNGETDFRKPISCHLFPIRKYGLPGDPGFLKYVKISECNPGVKKGRKEKVKLYEFLKDALVRMFGESWYSKLVSKLNNK